MASLPSSAPEKGAPSANNGSPSSSRSSGSNDSPDPGPSNQPVAPVVTISTPPKEATKEKDKKKKVGFAGDPSPPREEDYFSHTPLVGTDSAGNTPGAGVPDGVGIVGPASRRDSFDRVELTEALEKILKPEDHSGPQAVAANLTLPRPALRKTNYPHSPAEPVIGLSHPSEVEARNRAGRLAESVSGLASRTSVDLDEESNAGLLDHTDARDHALGGDNTASATGISPQDNDGEMDGLTYRKKAESDADRLVRKHTQRRAKELAMMSGIQTPDVGARSGTATPVAYDLEYVPPAPTKYLGGIMGSLLHLYSEDRQGSGATTPDVRTPNRTPRSSPPSTTPGTPRTYDPPSQPPSRPRSGLFGLGSRHSASTLAELIGSSSTLAAPASSNSAGKDWSDHVSGNLQKEREKKKASSRKSSRSQAKAQQILVTKQYVFKSYSQLDQIIANI